MATQQTYVFFWCVQVIMFLRMGFVVAHAGIFQSSLIILASLVLTVLSVTSLSAIATNGEVEGGGVTPLALIGCCCGQNTAGQWDALIVDCCG